MDLAVVIRRFFPIRMFLVHILLGRAVVIANITATVVMRFLDLSRAGVAMKTCGIRACEEAWLERRHDQKNDRKQRAERRNSCGQDSA
ncbi:hypothetical protein [Mesorhizobium comanense]|jgi:hypothetical protein|uniref:hypothetical protein n=1 Tax=Mesorhizobium comanense TaxID=2502215 RepID=UPI0010F5E72E|nr:hypothetical protein [Mesorhizobium comanense]